MGYGLLRLCNGFATWGLGWALQQGEKAHRQVTEPWQSPSSVAAVGRAPAVCPQAAVLQVGWGGSSRPVPHHQEPLAFCFYNAHLYNVVG